MVDKATSTFIEAAGVRLPVWAESKASRSFEQPSSMQTSINGTRWGTKAARASQDLALTFELTRPDELATLRALVGGEFGPGPFRLVDSWATHVNVLSESVSLLMPFVTNNVPGVTVSGGVELDDGSRAGRHLLAAFATMTPGWDFTAMAPATGNPVTVSTYVQSATGVRIRPLWYTANPSDPVVVGPTVTRPVAASGPLTRIHTTALVPATITPAGGSPAPVARVGLSVLDTTRITRPAISWTTELTEWGVGESPRFVMLEAPSVDVVKAWRGSGGRAASVTLTAREVGLP